jgi:hypothetical protein
MHSGWLVDASPMARVSWRGRGSLDRGVGVSRVRLTINMKFLVVLAAVLPLLVVVLWVAVAGLATVHSEIARVAGDNVRTSLATTDLGGDL